MTVTSPSTALTGSRFHVLSFLSGVSLSGTTDTTFMFMGTATAGVVLGRPFKVTKVVWNGDITAETADGVITATVYKGSVAAGNRAIEVTPTLTAVAVVQASSETVVNAGMDTFSATEGIIVRMFYDGGADSVTIASPNVQVFIEWAE